MELNRDDAVAQIDKACTGVLLDHAIVIPGGSQNLQVRGGRLDQSLAEPGEAALEHARNQWRYAAFHGMRPFGGGEHLLYSDHIEQLERAEIPAETPPHHSIHIVD